MFIPFDQLPADARVWVYPVNQPLTDGQEATLLENVRRFIDQWQSHGRNLYGSAAFFHHLFLVMAVDERASGVSGCSIDSSVHFLKQLGSEFQIDFFDRSRPAFWLDNQWKLIPLPEIKTHVQNGTIAPDTRTFNPVVTTVSELTGAWQVPAGKSWLAKYFRQPVLK